MASALLQRVALSALNLRARLLKKPPVLNPLDPAFRKNPYPLYRQLREADPVHHHPAGPWIVTRFADAEFVWSDPRFIHPPYGSGILQDAPKSEWLRSNLFIAMNPPDHTRLRDLTAPLFAPRDMDALRGRICARADELLDRAEKAGRMDLVSEFARPLPVAVIADLMGLPSADLSRLGTLSRELLGVVDAFPVADRRRAGEDAAAAFDEYFRGKIDERRARPGRDWISRLIEAQVKDTDFSDDELISTCAMMFIAGHETTVVLIAGGIQALLENPEQFTKLREDPLLMPGAIEECLRFDPPVQLIGRMAAEDVRIGGKQIRKGQTVFICIGAANRDPDKFADPERFDITRKPNPQLSFGRGIHNCMGQYLARMEGSIALAGLLKRFPRMRTEREAEYAITISSGRGLSSLALRLD